MNQLISWAQAEKNPYKLERSTTGHHSRGSNSGKSDVVNTRTSENAFDVQSKESRAIKRRSFQLARVPYLDNLADGIQIVRYQQKQAYTAHHDYFQYNTGSGHNWDPRVNGTNRFATVFLYLQESEEGGQTNFPLAAASSMQPPASSMPEDSLNLWVEGSWERKMVENCYEKLSVYPKKGGALLFYSQTDEGALDPRSLHGGCPVLKGEKWGANVWIWNGCRFQQTNHPDCK